MPYTVKRNRGGGGGVVNWVVCVGREERGGRQGLLWCQEGNLRVT